MNIKEIVADYLKANGYDGLHYEDDCSCDLDDLMPCQCANETYCKPGYKVVCNSGCGEYNFCIGEERKRGCERDERQWEKE